MVPFNPWHLKADFEIFERVDRLTPKLTRPYATSYARAYAALRCRGLRPAGGVCAPHS